MRTRVSTLIGLSIATVACAGGPPGPPALAYGLPAVTQVSYVVGDTLVVEINALGQSLELGVESVGTFAVGFARASDGVTVTLTVEDLEAELSAPLVAPIQADESIVSGDLVFTLDRRGNATVLATPEVDEMAAQLFSPVGIANTFFPRLPGRAVAAGDTWAETVAFEDSSDAGATMQSAVLEYTVVGDAQVEGRTLLEITFRGTGQVDQTADLQGTEIHQMTETEIEGRVLWDMQRGLMFELRTSSSGTGTVEVDVVPGRLPTRVESRRTVRLEG